MLSNLSGLSIRTVIRALNELEQIGIIKIFRRGGMRKPNIYTLIALSKNHDVYNRFIEVDGSTSPENKQNRNQKNKNLPLSQ
jgi:DNA-binding transcriptional regulator YhcF (GntR family)